MIKWTEQGTTEIILLAKDIIEKAVAIIYF